MKWLPLTLAVVCSAVPTTLGGQTTSVETFGTVNASTIANGFGLGIAQSGFTDEAQFAYAASHGVTSVHIQCMWKNVEVQSAPPQNVSQGYVQDPSCITALGFAAKYHLFVTEVAAFGPPYHHVLSLNLLGGNTVGSKSLQVSLNTSVGGATLASLHFPYVYLEDYTSVQNNTKPFGVLSNYGSFQGTLITGITLTDATHATLTLASQLKAVIPQGDLLGVNQVLYPSTNSTSPNDASVRAYGAYVKFLANDMYSRGLAGDIELWNEPPWNPDPWDNRGDLYDPGTWPGKDPGAPGPSGAYDPNYGFAAYLQGWTPPEGITLTWNGTSGNGTASLLNSPVFNAETGSTFTQPQNSITAESIHPYGDDPTAVLWDDACLNAVAAATSYPQNQPQNCSLPGEQIGSNLIFAFYYDKVAKLSNPAYGINHVVTETGTLPSKPGYMLQQARFTVNQFLGFMAVGLKRFEAFQFYDSANPNDPNFSFVSENGGVYTAKPNLTAMAGLVADAAAIGNPPVAYTSADLVSVYRYRGTAPLALTHIVGTRHGAAANSEILAAFQRTTPPIFTASFSGTVMTVSAMQPGSVPLTLNEELYGGGIPVPGVTVTSFGTGTGGVGTYNISAPLNLPSQTIQGVWDTQVSPPAGSVEFNVPAGKAFTKAVNATTRASVACTKAGKRYKCPVTDDAVLITVDPIAN